MGVENFDKRYKRDGRFRIAVKKETITLIKDTDPDVITADWVLNGVPKQIIFTIPALDNASETAEIKLRDEDANNIYQSGEKASSATHVLEVNKIDTETPVGDIDDSNKEYAIAYDLPFTLFYNGLEQTEGSDFTVSAKVITMTVAPETGSTLRVVYDEKNTVNVGLHGTITLRIEASASQTSDRAFVVTIYYE